MGFSIGKALGKLGGSATHSLGSIAGGAIGSIFGPAGAAIGSQIGGSLGPSQERMNRRDYNYQWQHALKAWDMQNAYNEPIAQMARLKAAGLNPMLVYGSGNVTGNASTSIDVPSLAGTDVMSGANGFTGLMGEMASNSFRQNMQEQRIAAQQSLHNNELDLLIKQAELEYLQKRNAGLTGPNGNVTKRDLFISPDTTIEDIVNNPNMTVDEKKKAISLINAQNPKTSFSTDPLAYIGRVFGGAYNYGRQGGAYLRKKMAERGYNVEKGYLPYK